MLYSRIALCYHSVKVKIPVTPRPPDCAFQLPGSFYGVPRGKEEGKKVKIGIVGLGLIGGSMAKAIKQFTDHTVYGQDLSAQVMKAAVKEKAIDQPLTRETIGECSLLLIALYPQAAVAWVKENRRIFSKNTLVVDLCGVKQVVCEPLFPLAEKEGFYRRAPNGRSRVFWIFSFKRNSVSTCSDDPYSSSWLRRKGAGSHTALMQRNRLFQRTAHHSCPSR